MREIDFLPVHYRARRLQGRRRLFRTIGVLAVAAELLLFAVVKHVSSGPGRAFARVDVVHAHRPSATAAPANLLTALARLKLQSTLVGGVPAAMINDQVLKEGDIVQGFIVRKIASGHVMLERDGFQFQLAMP